MKIRMLTVFAALSFGLVACQAKEQPAPPPAAPEAKAATPAAQPAAPAPEAKAAIPAAQPAAPAPEAPPAAAAAAVHNMEPAPAAADTAPAVRAVESKYVCMINNTLFAKEQIPVPVGDKTYYGCCAMCEKRLGSDPASREAVDPMTGKTVDKATATIGATRDGKVLYFESAESLAKYAASAK